MIRKRTILLANRDSHRSHVLLYPIHREILVYFNALHPPLVDTAESVNESFNIANTKYSDALFRCWDHPWIASINDSIIIVRVNACGRTKDEIALDVCCLTPATLSGVSTCLVQNDLTCWPWWKRRCLCIGEYVDDLLMQGVLYARVSIAGCSGLFCEIGGGGVFLLSTI